MMVYYSPALACISQWCGRYFGRYFNICDPGEGRLDVWNHTFTDGDPGKTAVFHSFFPTFLRLPNLTTQETLQPLETYALCQGLIVFFFFFKIYLWLKHVISMALLMSLRTSGRKLFRVTMLQYASSSRKLSVDDTRTNVFPVGCPNIPFLVPSCSSFVTTTDSLLTHFVHWLNFKFSCTKQRRSRNVSCQGRHLTASGQSFFSPLLLRVPIEIDILGQSCDVVKLGNLLKTALIQFPVSVLISSDSARFSLALLVKTFRHVKLRSPPSLGRTQKKDIALARCRSGQ